MNSGEKIKKMLIRPMSRGDLRQVLFIESISFPSPWPERLFLKELANPASDLFVAVAPDLAGDLVMGYIVCWLVAGEAHIQNIAAHPHFRRRGVASALLDYMLSFYFQQGAQNIYLEVREHNLPAKELYKKFHFRTVGLRKGYYSDTGENAIVMQRSISLDIYRQQSSKGAASDH
jgi:ribosomal-protein-alanine N-acetyltransferase